MAPQGPPSAMTTMVAINAVLLMACTEVLSYTADHPFLPASHRNLPLMSFSLPLAPSVGNIPNDATGRQDRSAYPFIYRLAAGDLPEDVFGNKEEDLSSNAAALGDNFLVKTSGMKLQGDLAPEDGYDTQSNEEDNAEQGGLTVAKRRKGPTLSVVNPLEVLRNRLMLDMARRRMKENAQQIQANAELLESVGKRSGPFQKSMRRESQSRR